MSYSSNVRKKQIKRCNKDGKYTFSIEGFGDDCQYLRRDYGYKLTLLHNDDCCMSVGSFVVAPVYAKGSDNGNEDIFYPGTMTMKS